MRPGPRLARMCAIVAALALLIPVAHWMAWLVIAAATVVCTLAIAETVALRRVRVDVERPTKIALALDESEEIILRVSMNTNTPLRITLRQRWPRLVEQRSTIREAICKPGEVVPLPMSLRGVARGTETIDPAAIACTFHGVMERVVTAGGTSQLHVLPNLKEVKRLHKQLNAFALRGIGARATPRIGKGREFDRLRDYVTDDDYRDIAWRASARHGRLIVRELRIDRSQDMLVCLDQGHRMAARVANITRLDHAINGAVLLAYICNRMEDRVGILAFDTDVDKGVPEGRGAAQLRAVTAYVTSLEAAYRHTDYLALAAMLRRRLHHRTLILMLTVLPEREERYDLLRAVEMLAPQHLPLIVTLGDPNLNAIARTLPTNREELARTLVARDLRMGRIELMRDLRARGALVVESTPEDAGIDAVNAYIDVKRRQAL